jgi:cellulose synthase (UDP-forming)
MLALILIPFDKQMPYFWLMLTPIAYYLIYGHDLVLANYSWSDLPRVFALNLLLIPVNLGGVAKSLHQWLTTRQTPFVRTPKVSGRTAVPALYIFLTWAIFWYAYVESLIDIRSHRYFHAWFALFNAAVFVYATLRFVGLMRCVEDTIASINFRLRSIFPRRQPAVLKTYPQ